MGKEQNETNDSKDEVSITSSHEEPQNKVNATEQDEDEWGDFDNDLDKETNSTKEPNEQQVAINNAEDDNDSDQSLGISDDASNENEAENINNAELQTEDEDDTAFDLDIDSPRRPTSHDQKTNVAVDNNEIIYMSEEDEPINKKYEDLPKNILKDTNIVSNQDNEFGDDDWGDFGDDNNDNTVTQKNEAIQNKESEKTNDVKKESVTAEDWANDDDDDWGDFDEPVTAKNETSQNKEMVKS